MNILQSTSTLLAVAMVVGTAHAQTVGVGTTKGGAKTSCHPLNHFSSIEVHNS